VVANHCSGSESESSVVVTTLTVFDKIDIGDLPTPIRSDVADFRCPICTSAEPYNLLHLHFVNVLIN